MATKTLNFYASNLQQDVDLLFVFQPPDSPALYRDLFPVVWTKIKFAAKQKHVKAVIRYVPRLAFGYAQTEEDNRVAASEWVDIKSGDSTSIIGTQEEKEFGPVTHNPDTNVVTCENKSGSPVDLNLGLVKGEGVNERFEATLLWKDLQRGTSATTKFIPLLQAYVDLHHKDDKILHEKIESEPIWTQNLNEIGDVTAWTLVEDSGGYRLEENPLPE
ncbi:hypothetical protein FRC07_004812 [Ceratobasidium sp. 392]|nr:hypothetical protein FRC07_004812 [Ceratobasidium sp. 392]